MAAQAQCIASGVHVRRGVTTTNAVSLTTKGRVLRFWIERDNSCENMFGSCATSCFSLRLRKGKQTGSLDIRDYTLTSEGSQRELAELKRILQKAHNKDVHAQLALEAIRILEVPQPLVELAHE
ncbi:hypothetical protein HY992_01075 [Candidatus Micrarchaeota archaeon]|nr:hypothetical protein [Candidatus Micrarchaeota archaeon]